MEDKKDYKESTQNSLKPFLIKLISVSFAVIVVISILFNMIFAERLEKIDNILFLDQSRMRNDVKDKIRSELSKGLNKKNMISEEDKILLYKLYLKIKKEFEDLDKTNL
jgi:hypothetical protein|tara:strand:- start:2031 stop:2357 length:327 start_codon:yes stop_codon:yes gene_type:complete